MSSDQAPAEPDPVPPEFDRAEVEQPGAKPAARPRAPGAGLCDSCGFQRRVPNTRGSVFSLCERSREDPAFVRYPRLPVRDCRGYEPRVR